MLVDNRVPFVVVAIEEAEADSGGAEVLVDIGLVLGETTGGLGTEIDSLVVVVEDNIPLEDRLFKLLSLLLLLLKEDEMASFPDFIFASLSSSLSLSLRKARA